MVINSLQFDDICSADFGVGISGEGVFDAPVRNVDAVSIPGRNGNLLIDRKSFGNIEVTYPAHNFVPNDYPTFTAQLDAFRSALASKVGYQRLVDTFHPDEYRMGVFKSGLEVNPIKRNSAAEFDLVFDCKPQRFLRSGEVKQTVAKGDIIVNPTNYEAKPLLEVTGYGTLRMAGQDIVLSNSVPLGDVTILRRDYSTTGALTVTLRPVLASGDSFTVTVDFTYNVKPTTGTTITSVTSSGAIVSPYTNGAIVKATKSKTFTFGTSASETKAQNVTVGYSSGGSTGTDSLALTIAIAYDGDSTITLTEATTSSTHTHAYSQPILIEIPDTIANSSKSALGSPTYIDLEIGEAYKIDSNKLVSLNNAVTLGGELPVLYPGQNTITFSNTITKVEITPRWWTI